MARGETRGTWWIGGGLVTIVVLGIFGPHLWSERSAWLPLDADREVICVQVTGNPSEADLEFIRQILMVRLQSGGGALVLSGWRAAPATVFRSAYVNFSVAGGGGKPALAAFKASLPASLRVRRAVLAGPQGKLVEFDP